MVFGSQPFSSEVILAIPCATLLYSDCAAANCLEAFNKSWRNFSLSIPAIPYIVHIQFQVVYKML